MDVVVDLFAHSGQHYGAGGDVQGGQTGDAEQDVGGAEDGTADDDVEGFVVGNHVLKALMASGGADGNQET